MIYNVTVGDLLLFTPRSSKENIAGGIVSYEDSFYHFNVMFANFHPMQKWIIVSYEFDEYIKISKEQFFLKKLEMS